MRKKSKLKLGLQIFGILLLLGATFIAVWQTGLVQVFFPRAGGVEADIVVDTQGVLGQMPQPWRYLAQGGEETEPMLDDVVGQVRALRPKYIRIDHIYDFYDVVSRDGSGQLTFNFSKLDVVVDSILATGAKPFISLSYMPPAISSGDIIDPPNDYSEWATVVARTVAHYSGRAGRNIPNIYYEVWNEPDLFGGYRTYGKKNYLSLYDSAVRGAMGVKNVQPFKIGGPATTGQYKNWFDNLLKYTANNNLRLDFYSWHRYSTDPGQFYKDVEDVKKWMEDHPNRRLDLELLITEWGHDSENNAGYDGMYAAAHTAAVAMEMVGRVDQAYVFEIKDGPDPEGKKYWGRWGLLTHESHGITAKPRYQALMWLNRLSSDRLSLSGKGTWVKALAAKKDDTTQVLMVNYDRRGKHTENVPVTFTNLKDREFLLEQSFLNGKSSTVNLATTAAKLKTNVFMPANSMVMLNFKPKTAASSPTSPAKTP